MYQRSIDSCKLLIPISKCTYDTRLTKKVYEIYFDFSDTGEIIKEHESKSICIKNLGYDTHYGSINLFGNKFIYILVNSKLLKSDYFLGIQSKTIKAVYNEIQRQNIVSLSYDDFLNCKLTDIDIKTDFDMYDEPFYRYCYDRKQALFYPKFFSKRPNLGIEYVKRSTATPSNPYVKYYSKSHELFTRSKEFKDAYLPNFINENLRRCEVTIRNHTHKQYVEKHLFKLPQTLGEWCSLTQDDYRQIIIHCVNQHEQKRIPDNNKKYDRTINKLTARNYFALKMYEELKINGYSDKHIIGLYDKREGKTDKTHYQEKSRISKFIREVRETYINTIEKLSPTKLPF